MDLTSIFQRVVCINLDRRPDRWARFQQQLAGVEWPFAPVERFSAVDGTAPGAGIPAWWRAGPGGWGVLQSHIAILRQAKQDGIESILIMEDDAVFAQPFAERVRQFFERVPEDWDAVMLGGQHLKPPMPVSGGVVRVINGNRCHAHALRRIYIVRALEHICDLDSHAITPHKHVDHRFGQLHQSGQWNVYAADPWLVGQADGRSDISNCTFGLRFWNGRGAKEVAVADSEAEQPHPPAAAPPRVPGTPGTPGTIVAVTTYFNPGGYVSMRAKYDRFVANLRRQNVPLVTVEIAIGDAPFVIDGAIQLRAAGPLWFKENAINIAVSRLSADVDCVAWLDNDLLLPDGWADRTVAALNHHAVVQLFKRVRDLDPNDKLIRLRYGLAYAVDALRVAPHDIGKATPGHAWAARRDVLDRVPLYDHAIVGGGDALVALGFFGQQMASVIDTRLARLMDFGTWAHDAHVQVGTGGVGWLPITINHLWHGDLKNRRYRDRYAIFERHGFCPQCDLRYDDNGLLALAGKPELQTDVHNYFMERREDG